MNIAFDNISGNIESSDFDLVHDKKNLVMYSKNKLFAWSSPFDKEQQVIWTTDFELFIRKPPPTPLTREQLQLKEKEEREKFQKLQEHLKFLAEETARKKKEEEEKERKIKGQAFLENLRKRVAQDEKRRQEQERQRLREEREQEEIDRRRRARRESLRRQEEEERKKKEAEEQRRKEAEEQERKRKEEEDKIMEEFMNRRQNKKHKISDATLKKLDKRFGKYHEPTKSKIRMFTKKQQKRILKLLGIKKTEKFDSFFDLHHANRLELDKVNRVNDYINTRIDRKKDPLTCFKLKKNNN